MVAGVAPVQSLQVSGMFRNARGRTVEEVSDFLIEVYVPRSSASPAGPRSAAISGATEQLAQEGRDVRFVRSVLIPEEETCFYFFQAQTRRAVCEAATRAGLRFERVLRAVSEWEAPSLPAPSTLPGHHVMPIEETHKGEQT